MPADPLMQGRPQMPDPRPVIEVSDARLRFGEVVALDGVTLKVMPGTCIGLVGHNGAGKSSIVAVLNGGISPQSGQISSDGQVLSPYGITVARKLGLRCVFQELSLCPNLTVLENTRLMHRNIGGWGWRVRAEKIITASLDSIFPAHGIKPHDQLGSLSIAQRQMVEIAMAFSDAGIPPRLVILDEPTSSLDAGLAAQLLAHVRRFVGSGGAVILISHILQEVIGQSDRIVVMKDGRIVADRAASDFTQDTLVTAMGSAAHAATKRGTPVASEVVLNQAIPGSPDFSARKGEVVGLAGLGGHGQTELLLALHDRSTTSWWPRRDPLVTFVAGDRRLNGTFDLWSIRRNLSLASLTDMVRHGLVRDKDEVALAELWRKRIDIRTPDLGNPILSLSGGNQQKVLFARALSTRAPVVLMDDPMRGVDIGTKQEVYDIIRAEADAGRTFVWYSTEMDEMALCDRVFVFRQGRIVAELTGEAITEAAILAASFQAKAA
jgi:ribose transport system ATP-binding protein